MRASASSAVGYRAACSGSSSGDPGTELIGEPKILPGELRIWIGALGITGTIELEGEWDIAHREATRAAVGEALQRRPECLVFDLSRLTFIDSSGAHILADTAKRCLGGATRLVIVPGPRSVQRVLEICGLLEILPFAPEES
jgi:anti-anti-sigma factor